MDEVKDLRQSVRKFHEDNTEHSGHGCRTGCAPVSGSN